MTETIGKYIKLLPIATLILIVASSIKLAVYYSVFNINIVDYLVVSEYIPLFIDDLHSLMYVLGALFLGFTLGDLARKKKVKEKGKNKEDNESDGFNKLKRYSYFFFIVAMVISISIISYNNRNSISVILEKANAIFIVFMIAVLMLLTTYKKISKIPFILWLLTLVFAPIIINAYNEAYTIIDGREELRHIIKVNNAKLNPELILLGSSNKYIFLYDKKNKESIIKPISGIDEIRILEKK